MILPKLKKLNKSILFLTLSDVFVWGIYSVTVPLEGIYLSLKFGEKSIEYVTLGLCIYFIIRAILPIPIGRFVDKTKKDLDEIFSLGFGSTLIGLSFIIFPFITSPIQYFFLTALAGTGTAFNLIGWRKLFAKNLDPGREGMEYASYETLMSLCTAVICLLGGTFSNVNHDLFRVFFFIVGSVTMIGGILMAVSILKTKRKSADAL